MAILANQKPANMKLANKKILLILGAIGDTLMFTPTLEVLKKTYPEAQIDAMVMFGGSGSILEKNLAISKIFVVPFFSQSIWQNVKQIKEIRRAKYDLSILGYPAFRKEYHFLSWLLGAKRRLAHDFRSGHYKELAFLETDRQRVDYSAHNIENNLNLLSLLDIDWKKYLDLNQVKYTLNLKDEWIKEANEYLIAARSQKPLPKADTPPAEEARSQIGLHPGSTQSPAALMRRWPPDRFAAVADRLIEEKQAQIFIFAGPEEKDVAQQIKNLMKHEPIIVDNLKLGPVMALISKLNLFVSNDSGLGHIAAAVNTPLVAIWGSTNPRLSGPKNGEKVKIIRQANFPAWHWYENKRSIPAGCENLSGMEAVTVDDCLKAVEKLLNKN